MARTKQTARKSTAGKVPLLLAPMMIKKPTAAPNTWTRAEKEELARRVNRHFRTEMIDTLVTIVQVNDPQMHKEDDGSFDLDLDIVKEETLKALKRFMDQKKQKYGH
jgi:hypothetical protein